MEVFRRVLDFIDEIRLAKPSRSEPTQIALPGIHHLNVFWRTLHEQKSRGTSGTVELNDQAHDFNGFSGSTKVPPHGISSGTLRLGSLRFHKMKERWNHGGTR